MAGRWRRYAVPASAGLLLFLLAFLAGFLTGPQDGTTSSSSVAPAAAPGTRGTVQSLSGDTLTLQVDGASRQFSLRPGTHVEVLRQANTSAIVAGDWVNLGTTPNAQTIYTIVGLTLIPRALLDQ